MSQKFSILVFFAFVLSLHEGYSQNPGTGNDLHVNSPYSSIGIGELAPIGNLRNIGMGGTGVSFGHPEFINSLNPALLINNRVTRYDSLITILEGSGFAQLRRLSNANGSQLSGNVNFNAFAYAVPVSKRWTVSVGLHPLTNVSYTTLNTEQVAGSPSDSVRYTNAGHGGIYQADFANGIKIHKNLNLGIQASYLFGTIHNESTSQVLSHSDSLRVGSNLKTAYSGFLFRPGVSFRKKIQTDIHPDTAIFINVGFTYDIFANMNSRETLLLQRRNQGNIVIDQSTVANRNSDLTFPSGYRFGLSFDRYQKWNVGAEFAYTNWSNYNGKDAGETMKNSFSLALGGEFLVNSKDNRRNGNLNPKKNYARVGFNYTQTPYYLAGNQIKDVSFTLGYTFAVGDVKRTYGLPLPKLNVALVLGQRGTTDAGLIKDLYIKGYFGITINDKWFRKRRID